MEKILIYGNGKIAKILYSYLSETYEVVAFTVDDDFMSEKEIMGVKVEKFSSIETIFPPDEVKMIIAVGYVEMNAVRERKYKEAKEKGYHFINYIHSSVLNKAVSMGENNIVLDNVSIQPFAEIGNSNFIWSNAVVAHGCKIEDNCWITSGVTIAGDSIIKSNCFLGVNATVGHNVTIGKENFIGANTLVSKDTNDSEVYVSRGGEKYRLDSQRFLKFTGV